MATSLRTVFPSVGSPTPSSLCSLSITSMKRSVSVTDMRLPSSPPRSRRASAKPATVASTANRPSIVSGTPPAVYQLVLRASAVSAGQPLYRRIADLAGVDEPRMPMPMVNILSGGLHAGRGMDVQDFLAVPVSSQSSLSLRH